MKFCCTSDSKKSPKTKRITAGISFVLAGVLAILILADGFLRSIIEGYPMSVATGVMTEMMDKAMENVLTDSALDPNEVDVVIYDTDGRVLSIETNTNELTKIKTNFVSKLNEMLYDYGDIIKVSIPIGTLIGHEYTLGRGPKITFDLQYSYSISAELNSTFYEAGINNTVHSIELVVTNDIFIIIPWGHSRQKVSTKYIIAETVIVGDVPDAFTNVYGTNGEVADEIANYGAEKE